MTTVEEMKTALLSNGGLDGGRVTVVTARSVFSDQEQAKITSVNKFNNSGVLEVNWQNSLIMQSKDTTKRGRGYSSHLCSCPVDSCIRVFQCVSGLERHLSLEACFHAVKLKTLLDIRKEEYAKLEEGIGAIPFQSNSVLISRFF